MPAPTEIRLDRAARVLHVSFEDGTRYALPAEYLRVESPSAEVQGHNPSQRVVVKGKQNVRIVDLKPIGNYAIQIVFDDGHNTGLFTWDYIRELSQRHG